MPGRQVRLAALRHAARPLPLIPTAALDRARQCYSWQRAATQLTAIYGTVSGVRQPSRVVAPERAPRMT